ncbi:MAG: hypothetical protein N2482_00880 [Patescibacteria group bacterium]|nr:hypothetical protein [Patescibacteria group bacterium]
MSNSKNFPYGISRSETIYSAVLNTSLKTIDFSFGRPINLISYKNKIKISL